MKLLKILRKTTHDPLGLFSVCYILLVGFIAIFAEQLAPDSSDNANQMHVSIHSKPPGFSTTLLLIPSADGRLREEIPIRDYRWEGNRLFYTPYGRPEGYVQEIKSSSFPAGMSRNAITENYIEERTFLWGTDKFGRDLLSRMLFGSRISFFIGFIAVLISLLVGIFFGGIAGYFGGMIDRCIVWLINVMWSIPSLLMVIVITLALGKGYWQVFIAVGLTMWVDVARLVRGQVLAIKAYTHVEAAHLLGFSSLNIFFTHIFPLLIPSLIVISTANFASAILIESGLSFLGIGAQPPIPSWGGMVKDHFRYILLGKPYLALIPGIAIMSLVLAFMQLGNSLRDALDVKN